MTPNLRELAKLGVRARLAELAAERDALLKMFPELIQGARKGRKPAASRGPVPKPEVRRHRPMSAAQKKAVGERMKRYWAARRAEKSTVETQATVEKAPAAARRAGHRQSRKK